LTIGNIIPKGGTKVYINIAPIIDFIHLVAGCATLPPAEEITKRSILSRTTKNLPQQRKA
jgi:hypothetical protein